MAGKNGGVPKSIMTGTPRGGTYPEAPQSLDPYGIPMLYAFFKQQEDKRPSVAPTTADELFGANFMQRRARRSSSGLSESSETGSDEVTHDKPQRHHFLARIFHH